jgi:hypothetical protein
MQEAVDELVRALESAEPALLEKHVAAWKRVWLPANVPPWTPTGIALEEGESFSWLAAGRVVLSEEAGLWNGPRFHLWGRVAGRRPLLNGTRDTTTLRAPASGELELCIYSGEWATRDGELAGGAEGYALLGGGIDAVVIRWRDDASAGLAALAAALPQATLLRAEAGRVASPVPVPAGWTYLWFLGRGDLYTPVEAGGGRSIRAVTEDDVGILCHPVDVPLTPDTRVSWRWKVDRLPSDRAEDSLPTHDYLSLALAFDNGLDLTWYWSAALEPDSHYRCPLPHWDQREWHVVVRSGADGLGAWQTERRDVLRDYERAIGGAAPTRITGVWLIAVSIFQKGRGEAEFADIEITSDGRVIRVLDG